MIAPEKRKQVRALSEKGYSVRRIARALRISRNTVREILDPARRERRRERRRQKAAQPGQEQKAASLLEPYKSRIQELLEEEEKRLRHSRREKPLTSKHFLKDLRKRGYKGGRTILDDYLRTLRGPKRRARKPFARIETLAAEESQQDWSPYTVKLAGKPTQIQLFSLILCWSRYQFLKAYLDLRQSSLLWGHAAAFEYFEGVPWKILYDWQKTIALYEIDGRPILHEKFEAFANHYGFDVRVLAPGDKERKGKVERPFEYFETSFLPGRNFESLQDLNRQLRDWLDGLEDPEEGNARKHGTTNEVPRQRWLEEKQYLLELPASGLLPRRIEQRQVEKDCTFSLDGTRYTVPARLVEKGQRKVWVSVGEEDLVVHDQGGEVVARHRIDRTKKLVIDPEHYNDIRRARKPATRLPELEERLLELFPEAKEFLDGLKRTVRSIAPIHLREIFALVRRYRRQEVAAAIARAIHDGTTTAGYVRSILERNHPTGYLASIEIETPRGLAIGPVSPGSSEGYGAIFEHENDSKETNRDQEHHDDNDEN